MANLRAGLIGLGMMGRHHARVLGSLEGVDLVAVADPGGDVGPRGQREAQEERRDSSGQDDAPLQRHPLSGPGRQR